MLELLVYTFLLFFVSLCRQMRLRIDELSFQCPVIHCLLQISSVCSLLRISLYPHKTPFRFLYTNCKLNCIQLLIHCLG